MRFSAIVLTDLHYAPDGPPESEKRRGEIADILLLRAINRINRLHRPDVVVLGGDLLERGEADSAPEAFERLARCLRRLDAPVLAIPGNHDGPPEAFERALGPVPEYLDVGAVRLVPFVDPEEPHWCARRHKRDLECLAAARRNFDGPLVAVQHVPLFPPGQSDCPYFYTNAEAVIESMRAAGATLSIGGHYHPGLPPMRAEGVTFVNAPALCEAPFAYVEIAFDTGRPDDVELRRHKLRMPPALGLVDTHVHTPFAYCNENMDIALSLRLARDFGLAGVGFSEHADQLYLPLDGHAGWEVMMAGFDGVRPEHSRVDAYFAALEAAGVEPAARGFEVDYYPAGQFMLRDADRARAGYVTGAVHDLPCQRRRPVDPQVFADEFLHATRQVLRRGVAVLNHPFRVFRREGLDAPERLYDPVIALLRESGAAAEINYHTNDPSPEFFRRCIEAGVPLALGGDAHNLYEIGAFALHLDLLDRIGALDDLGRLAIDPRRGRPLGVR